MVSLRHQNACQDGEIRSFKAVGIHRWCNSTFNSVPASSDSTRCPLHPRESMEQWVAMWLGVRSPRQTQALFVGWRKIAIALIDPIPSGLGRDFNRSIDANKPPD